MTNITRISAAELIADAVAAKARRVDRLRAVARATCLVVGSVAMVAAAAIHATSIYPDAFANVLPACATEDSTWCYWDASTRGNGIGTSFVTLLDGLPVELD